MKCKELLQEQAKQIFEDIEKAGYQMGFSIQHFNELKKKYIEEEKIRIRLQGQAKQIFEELENYFTCGRSTNFFEVFDMNREEFNELKKKYMEEEKIRIRLQEQAGI